MNFLRKTRSSNGIRIGWKFGSAIGRAIKTKTGVSHVKGTSGFRSQFGIIASRVQANLTVQSLRSCRRRNSCLLILWSIVPQDLRSHKGNFTSSINKKKTKSSFFFSFSPEVNQEDLSAKLTFSTHGLPHLWHHRSILIGTSMLISTQSCFRWIFVLKVMR